MKVQPFHTRYGVAWSIMCPACLCGHRFTDEWEFNYDFDKPTFDGSMLIKLPGFVCHSFVKDGEIEFLKDCTHKLAGQTISLPSWE